MEQQGVPGPEQQEPTSHDMMENELRRLKLNLQDRKSFLEWVKFQRDIGRSFGFGTVDNDLAAFFIQKNREAQEYWQQTFSQQLGEMSKQLQKTQLQLLMLVKGVNGIQQTKKIIAMILNGNFMPDDAELLSQPKPPQFSDARNATPEPKPGDGGPLFNGRMPPPFPRKEPKV